MSKSITQDMAYRQSLMKYAAKYGVSRASRKYNKSRSYIYFWKQRWDGSVESLRCESRRTHSHPNRQYTETVVNQDLRCICEDRLLHLPVRADQDRSFAHKVWIYISFSAFEQDTALIYASCEINFSDSELYPHLRR